MGELQHALARGLVPDARQATELGAIVSGRATGRQSDDEVIVFDATGIAIQDAGATAMAYRRAVRAGVGTDWNRRA